MGENKNKGITNWGINKWSTFIFLCIAILGVISSVIIYSMTDKAAIEANTKDILELKDEQKSMESYESRITANEIRYDYISNSLIRIENKLEKMQK